MLGVDEALRRTGVCLNRNGALSMELIDESASRGTKRLQNIRDRVAAILHAERPDLLVLEFYSLYSTNRPFAIGELGGVLQVTAADLGVEHVMVPPSLLKRFATGSGAAVKDRVMRDVHRKYGEEVDDDNIADAIALAKFGEVLLTGRSDYRSELESVRRFQRGVVKTKKTFTKAKVSV